MEARFVCNVPRSVVQDGAVRKLRPSLYGHGLLGDAFEVNSRNVRQLGNENGVLVCAPDWSGMSEEDVPNVARDPVGPLEVPEPRRSQPAGVRQLPLPRSAARPIRRGS